MRVSQCQTRGTSWTPYCAKLSHLIELGSECSLKTICPGSFGHVYSLIRRLHPTVRQGNCLCAGGLQSLRGRDKRASPHLTSPRIKVKFPNYVYELLCPGQRLWPAIENLFSGALLPQLGSLLCAPENGDSNEHTQSSTWIILLATVERSLLPSQLRTVGVTYR